MTYKWLLYTASYESTVWCEQLTWHTVGCLEWSYNLMEVQHSIAVEILLFLVPMHMWPSWTATLHTSSLELNLILQYFWCIDNKINCHPNRTLIDQVMTGSLADRTMHSNQDICEPYHQHWELCDVTPTHHTVAPIVTCGCCVSTWYRGYRTQLWWQLDYHFSLTLTFISSVTNKQNKPTNQQSIKNALKLSSCLHNHSPRPCLYWLQEPKASPGSWVHGKRWWTFMVSLGTLKRLPLMTATLKSILNEQSASQNQ